MKKIFVFILLMCVLFSFKKREIEWVAIGDSITYLNEHPDETGNRVKKGYLTRVQEKLKYIHYKNKGFNGWTSGQVAEKFENLGIKKADVYTIFLGTNDWWRGRKIGSFKDYESNKGNNTIYGSFRIIIDKLKSLNPEAKIVLITPMKRSDFVYIHNMKNNAWGSYREKDAQNLEDVANAVITISNHEKFPVIDLFHNRKLDYDALVKFKRLKDPVTRQYKNFQYPDYTTISFDPEKDEYPYPSKSIGMTYDGLHPSDKGNKIIANKIVTVFRNYRF